MTAVGIVAAATMAAASGPASSPPAAPASSPPPRSATPRSVPPPLPPHALKPPSEPPRAAVDPALESEIDASLDALELESPALHARPQPTRESLARPAPARESAVPATEEAEGDRAERLAAREPLATERPALASDGLDTFHPPPPTGAPEDAEHATGDSLAHEELASGELEDVEDPTGIGVNMEDALRAAGHDLPHAAHDDEIVIADDLAEDVADDVRQQTQHDDEPAEEHTDANVVMPAVPPFRAP
jgi:hypothetical protein